MRTWVTPRGRGGRFFCTLLDSVRSSIVFAVCVSDPEGLLCGSRWCFHLCFWRQGLPAGGVRGCKRGLKFSGQTVGAWRPLCLELFVTDAASVTTAGASSGPSHAGRLRRLLPLGDGSDLCVLLLEAASRPGRGARAAALSVLSAC